MATPAFVRVAVTGSPDLFLYQHWDGPNLVETVRTALARQVRWDDAPYLARIIFSQMIAGDVTGETGFGIQTIRPEGIEIVVDVTSQKVTYTNDIGYTQTLTFKEFVTPKPTGLTLADLSDAAVLRLGFKHGQHAYNAVQKAVREATAFPTYLRTLPSLTADEAALFVPGIGWGGVPVALLEAVARLRGQMK